MNKQHDSATYWVFGYGSLIWRPGFSYVQAEQALLRGAHRSLCIYSHIYRGTPEHPGLVFGLQNGGSCHGMAFEVAAAQWDEVRTYLYAREMVNKVYFESPRQVRLSDGRSVEALAFISNTHHSQFAGRLSLDDQVRYVQAGHGKQGSNVDYVMNTARHLADMGIIDQQLKQLADRLDPESEE